MATIKYDHLTEDAGGVVINEKTGYIALVKMHHNVWGFPKGQILRNEQNRVAAEREVCEETGIERLEFERKLGSYERDNSYNSKERLKIYMFLFKTLQDDLHPVGQTVAEAKWVNKDEVLNYLTIEEDIKFFKSIKKHL